MNETSSVITTNNRGVLLLEAGRFRDALLEFQKGLEKATRFFRRKFHIKLFFAFPDSIEWSRDLLRQEAPLPISPFVYARAMRIIQGDIVPKVILGALTYNFALTSHLRFVEIGERGHEMAYSTLGIYKSARVLLQGSPLCLAVLNNMRQINHSLKYQQAASECRIEILKLIDLFSDCFAFENQDLFAETLLNLETLQEVTVALAA